MRIAVLTGAMLIGALILLHPASLLAQGVPRPRLDRDADVNNWEAYYDRGVVLLPQKPREAARAFYWASRLDPARAEPLYARWIAFWASDIERFGKWVRDDEATMRAPEVVAVDSLRAVALQRNPFVHQGLVVLLYDALPGRWNEDILTAGWRAYGQGHLQVALDRFAVVLRRDPVKHGELHFLRASAFVNLARYDSAAGELDTLLASLRARDERTLGERYESKDLMEYAIGLLHLQGRQPAAAREAFGRSVVENPAFAASHGKLGELALAARDTAMALQEFAQAVEVGPSDVMVRLGYARSLRTAGHLADAVLQAKAAVSLAPDYAETYLELGSTLRTSGDVSGARTAFTAFLAHALRTDSRRGDVERLLAAMAE